MRPRHCSPGDHRRPRAPQHRSGVRRHHHDRPDRGHPPGRRTADRPPKTPPPAGLGYIPATTEQPLAQNISAILISPPQAPADTQWTPPTAHRAAGQAPNIISRAEWGADEALRCGNRPYDNRIRAAVVHHTAGSNDYQPQESAAIVKAIYTYHTKTLGWCDIAYNALVDKYGQVFEGSAGALTGPVEGFHTGGFNRNTWGVAMIGNFDDVAPTPIQLHTLGRLIGWRLGLDNIDPRGTVALESAGGENTTFPVNAVATLPTIFTHRDVGATDCPGNVAYGLMDEIRDIAAHFNDPPRPGRPGPVAAGRCDLRPLADDRRPEQHPGRADLTRSDRRPAMPRYATFDKGAMYWSPETGPQAVTGAIYDAWASLGYERGALGLPTSSEIQEPHGSSRTSSTAR